MAEDVMRVQLKTDKELEQSNRGQQPGHVGRVSTEGPSGLYVL